MTTVCRIAQYVERRVINPCVDGANPSTATNCCDDIATESEEDMSIDIATITCPSCGADADSLCFYPGMAFCMECGDVFDLAEKREAQQRDN